MEQRAPTENDKRGSFREGTKRGNLVAADLKGASLVWEHGGCCSESEDERVGMCWTSYEGGLVHCFEVVKQHVGVRHREGAVQQARH
jgi:hypothetical protein